MPAPSVTYTFNNGTTADATQVNQNFTDLVNSLTDSLKDLTINAITLAGTLTANGNVDLGNATSDTITCTGRFDADLDPATAATYDFGDATQTWRAVYIDNTTTDGGAIYFDGGSTEFLKSTADGTTLDVGGFTSLDLNVTADIVGGKHIYAAVNDGTNYDEGDPVYSFTGDTNTGMFSESADRIDWATGGTLGMYLDSSQDLYVPSGKVNIGTTSSTTDGLVLNNTTTSYSPTTLNYFEETTFSATFTQSGGYSQAITVKVSRVGSIVTLELPSFGTTTTASAAIVSGADIPARFRPAIEMRMFAAISNNGATNTPGGFYIKTTGVMEVYIAVTGATFTTGTASCGLGAGGGSTQSFTYRV